LLSGAGANEGAFRVAAPLHTLLHISTHGFFAPKEFQSTLDRSIASAGFGGKPIGSDPLDRLYSVAGYHPGLLSGLALAGANVGARLSSDGVPTTDDGILTALEVAAYNLARARLVVLSACESGRGKEAGGEGAIGLQRAFQMAGARAVVASLWKVDDEMTSNLMTKFYRNLWQEKMTPLMALRQAQLDIKNNGPGDSGHPQYWAAWVLSGDPGAMAR
jgi:CHAT domain-containing protein